MTYTIQLSDEKYIQIDVSELTAEEVESISPDEIVSIAREEPEGGADGPGIGRYLLVGAVALGAIAVIRRLGGDDDDSEAEIEIEAEEATA